MTNPYTPSPIREHTAFMAELMKLRTEYEKNTALLYTWQGEFKATYNLFETVKEFGFGDLDQLVMSVSYTEKSLQISVWIEHEIVSLLKALDITGVSYTAHLSDTGRRLNIVVNGYPQLVFIAPSESVTLFPLPRAAVPQKH